MKRKMFFLTSGVFFCLLPAPGVILQGAVPDKKTSPPAILKHMQAVLKQYETKPTVTMNFKKKSFLKLLKKRYTSSGKVFLSSHHMVVLMEGENTKVVIDKKKDILWYVKSPSQVYQKNLKTGDGDLSVLPLVFSPRAFLKAFRFVSIRSKGRSAIWEFVPRNHGSQRIKALFLKMENKLVLTVRVQWKELGNEEEYEFSDIRFNQTVDNKYFRIPVSKS